MFDGFLSKRMKIEKRKSTHNYQLRHQIIVNFY